MQNRKEGEVAFFSGHWPLDPDKPTLIFVHGAGLNKACRDNQVTGLSDVANTIAIDLPGHGDSPFPARRRSLIMPGLLRTFLISSIPPIRFFAG